MDTPRGNEYVATTGTTHTDDHADVLTDFLHATGGSPTRAQVTEWCRRYPEQAAGITQLAATLAYIAAAAPDPESLAPDPAAEARGVATAMRLRRALAPVAAPSPVAPFPGILAAATEHDLTAQSLAAVTRLSPLLVGKLDRRQITPGTVPESLIVAIAAAVGRAADTVRDYLAGSPRLAPSMQFRADTPPTAAAIQDFAEAVRTDPTLDAGDRAHWGGETQ